MVALYQALWRERQCKVVKSGGGVGVGWGWLNKLNKKCKLPKFICNKSTEFIGTCTMIL